MNQKIAEALLSLASRRDVAISITGDLFEERQLRGTAWFWWHVFRTIVSFVLQELSSGPVRTIALLVFGRLMLIAGSTVIARPLMDIYLECSGLELQYALKWWVIVVLWGRVACPLLVGLVIAKFSPGKEFVVCIALATLTEAHFVLLSFWMAQPIDFLLLNSVPLLPLLVAGVVSRWGTLSRISGHSGGPAVGIA